ncbi:MAG: response regulator [Planctomycetota bacterium]|jgi:DNA-binding NarL/FixJ family response regulator
MINVLIADDHAVVREGVKRIVEECPDMTVRGEAKNADDLLRLVSHEGWDVVVMDLAMPGTSGLDLLESVRRARPTLPVLVLSMYPADQYAVRCIQSGAAGYLNKGCPPVELLEAIRVATHGRHYLNEEVAESLAHQVDRSANKPCHERLSNREFEVMKMIACGQTVSEIADVLSLSVKTVSTYRTRILEKLDLHHNADLIRYALQHGIVN